MSDIKELNDKDLRKINGGVLARDKVDYIISSLESILNIDKLEGVNFLINTILNNMRLGSYMQAYENVNDMLTRFGCQGTVNETVMSVIHDIHDILYFEFITV